MSEPRGPIRSLWSACLLLLGAVFLLWVAYQLFLSMWVWVVAIIAAALVVTAAILWIRWRYGSW